MSEGFEVYGVEDCTRVVDFGEGFVGVDVGVAVAGEVFGHGLYASVFKAEGVGHAEFSDPPRVFAERACADDGVGGVGVYVEVGGEINLNACETALAGHFASVAV